MASDNTSSAFHESGTYLSQFDSNRQYVYQDKMFCLTGRFKTFKLKAKMHAHISQQGGHTTKGLNNTVDYLLIGGAGNIQWSESEKGYGDKIKQALAMQSKGHPIKIVHEDHWLHGSRFYDNLMLDPMLKSIRGINCISDMYKILKPQLEALNWKTVYQPDVILLYQNNTSKTPKISLQAKLKNVNLDLFKTDTPYIVKEHKVQEERFTSLQSAVNCFFHSALIHSPQRKG